jgi:hypothetical protein
MSLFKDLATFPSFFQAACKPSRSKHCLQFPFYFGLSFCKKMLSDENQFYIYLSQFTDEPTSSLQAKVFKSRMAEFYRWPRHGKHLF